MENLSPTPVLRTGKPAGARPLSPRRAAGPATTRYCTRADAYLSRIPAAPMSPGSRRFGRREESPCHPDTRPWAPGRARGPHGGSLWVAGRGTSREAREGAYQSFLRGVHEKCDDALKCSKRRSIYLLCPGPPDTRDGHRSRRVCPRGTRAAEIQATDRARGERWRISPCRERVKSRGRQGIQAYGGSSCPFRCGIPTQQGARCRSRRSVAILPPGDNLARPGEPG